MKLYTLEQSPLRLRQNSNADLRNEHFQLLQIEPVAADIVFS